MPRQTTALLALLLAGTAGMAGAQPVAPPPAPLSPMPLPPGPIVNLSVTESVEAAPDRATINTGVETRAMTASDAMGQNAARIDALIAALRKAGIDPKDMRTGRISLSPQYDYSNRNGGEGPRFTGYMASNMLSVTLRQLDKAGQTIDAMVAAGATNIDGPNLEIADTGKLEAQARDQAMKTAATRAAAYARAAGYASARLLEISETGMMSPPMPMPLARSAAFEAAPATKIEPGTLSASITLSFRYMLER